MYSDPRLDTPPPQSQFRRPWSPDPYDPLPSNQNSRNIRPYHESHFPDNQYAPAEPDFQPDYGYNYLEYSGSAPRRRDPSDVSVEALDLADYAMTLRAHQADVYQGQYGRDMYPPSPPTHRPFANRPPSVVSRMDTLSSNTHASSSRGRNPPRRPFSLPPPSVQSRSSRHTHTTSPRSANSHTYRHTPNSNLSSPRQDPRSSQPDIDTAHFPAWSRNWYNNKPKPADDIYYTALPQSSWNPKRSPFDPGNTFPIDSFPQSSDPYDPYGHPSSSLGFDSSRDVLPWSSEPPEYGPVIDASLKEERMRMLEREFGPNAKGKGAAQSNGDFLDENGKPLVGTVDSKGQLVTKGPRKRMALRVTQILLSLAAAIPAIYAALVIKPKGTPPPSGTVAAYILYVFSILTVLLLLYLFAFRPCCCPGKRRKGGPGPGGNPLANGMMVLPVSGLPGGKKNKAKGKKGKNGKNGMPGDVQVNLIVDPNAFGGRQDEDDDSDTDDDETGSVPGSFDPASARRKRKRAKRRSVFAGLAMEEDWKKARSWAKKITAVDVLGIILWGATFIFILIGKRCPSGSFDGWCNAYNVSSAAACLLCVSFGVGIFFDVQDLHSSKASPRTRA
ncbi:hypothetical protein B0H11DRAFT_1701845 [Mycena galericulata]|nr:hypothetical protein B0H11DRAFT_1701845 [Mycena galericulata]